LGRRMGRWRWRRSSSRWWRTPRRPPPLMSYTRDPDYYTRGIGAVQAVDKVKSKRRTRLELERRRALARTDAKKVGLMGLGALNVGLRQQQYQFGRQTSSPTTDGGYTVLPNPGPVTPPQPGGRGGPLTPP